MSTVITRYPYTAVGPGAAALPVLYPAPPSLGADGDDYAYRWRAESILGVAVDADITSWPTVGGTNPLTVPAGRTAPTLKAAGDRRYVSFDGVNDVLQSAGGGLTGQHTIVVVAKVAATDAAPVYDILSMADSTDIGMAKPSGGTGYGFFFPGSANQVLGGVGINAWKFLAMTFDAAEAFSVADAAVGAPVASNLTAAGLTSLRLAFLNSANPGVIDVAEVITYTGKKTSAQLASIRAALRAQQAGLLP